MKTISKEMRKRQKYFPWLKTFMKEYLKAYPDCKKSLKYLVENIEKEVKEFRKGQKHKQRTKALFETVNDLYLHFWWKIHWKQNSQWKNYWNVNTTHSYQSCDIVKCFGKLLNCLVYLGITLSQGASDSLWINRVLLAINILPVNDEIVYDAVLQLNSLKRKYRSSYIEILRHILCSELILNISEPAVYIKSLMLFRRLKNFMDDEVAKASLISTASKIKPPSNLAFWLSSLEISIDVNKSIVDQLFQKNSKQVFQKLYHVLIDSGSNNNEKKLKSKKKSDDIEPSYGKEEENLFRVAIGVGTPTKDISYSDIPLEKINIDGKNNQLKKVLHLSKLCNKIKNSKKKSKHNTSMSSNLSESNTKTKQQLMNTKTSNRIISTLGSQNVSITHKKSRKKKKPKVKNDNTAVIMVSENANTKTNKTSRSKKSKNRKKSKETGNGSNAILDNRKSDLSCLETLLNDNSPKSVDDSVPVNSKSHTEGGNPPFGNPTDSIVLGNNSVVNVGKESIEGNSAAKEVKLTHSLTENGSSQADKEINTDFAKNSNDKVSNRNVLRSKLPNLLANYEIYSSAEENETPNRGFSSCHLVESGDILVPDTCQNDYNSIVPFNLDSWVPIKDDASRDNSVSNDGSLNSAKYSCNSLTDMHQNNQSDHSNSSFNDSIFAYTKDSEASRDTIVSNYGSEISDKYPYVSLVDVRKNKDWVLYHNSDTSNSSLDTTVLGNINDSEVSQDTCISYGSQISDKNPYASPIDIKKVKINSLNQKSDNSFSVGIISDSEKSQDAFFSNEGSQILDKDPNDSKKVDKSAQYMDSNYDPILGHVISNFLGVSNQNPDNSSCHDSFVSRNRNDESKNTQVENHLVRNENEDSELPSNKTPVKDKQFHQNKKNSKTRTLSTKRDMVCTNLKTKTNSPTKRKRKQKSCTVTNKRKKKCSSAKNKDLVQPNERKSSQILETSANNMNEDSFFNDLSTLLPNHGDIETQENETISPLREVASNNSNVAPNELNETQIASQTSYANAEKEPCITLTNEDQHNNLHNRSIETVIDELIESVRLSDNVAGNVHSIGENTCRPLQTNSDLVPSDCFSYESNLNTPQQSNNQGNILSISSTTDNRSVESEVAQSLLNISVNENSQRVALPSTPDDRNQNTSLNNASLNLGNSNYVIDCNIINDFDSRNSSRAGSSVSGDTTTIKVILNLINSKPDNSSNSIPNSSGNGFLAASNSSQGLHSSVASGQLMNCSFPVRRNSSYFSEPPFFTRRIVNELDTPPDSESHLRIPSPPRLRNIASSCCDDQLNFISSKSKDRPYVPENISRIRQQNEFLHSSESANDWGISQYDFNQNPNLTIRQSNSFSNTPSMQKVHFDDVPSTLNVHQNGNNHSLKSNRNKESILRSVEQSTSTGKKTTSPNARKIVSYRNSRPNIYSEESEDELSVSTMSLLSGEETDHSLIKSPDKKISPKSPLQRKNNVSKNKTRKLFHDDKWALDTPTVGSSYEISTLVEQPKPQKKGWQKRVVKITKKPKINLKNAYNLRSRNLLTPPTKLKSYFT